MVVKKGAALMGTLIILYNALQNGVHRFHLQQVETHLSSSIS